MLSYYLYKLLFLTLPASGFSINSDPSCFFTSPRRDYLCLGLVFLGVNSENNVKFPASLNTVGALGEET